MPPCNYKNSYCVSKNHYLPKNLVCCERECENKGLVCSFCAQKDHSQHKTVSLSQYLDYVSSTLSSINQEKLLSTIDQFQDEINKEVQNAVEQTYQLHLQLDQQLKKLTTFQFDFSQHLDNLKFRYQKVCNESNQIRTPADILPATIHEFTNDTLDLLYFNSMNFNNYAPTLSATEQKWSDTIFSDAQILKDQPLYQKYKNSLRYSQILSAQVSQTNISLQKEFNEFFSDMNASLDILTVNKNNQKIDNQQNLMKEELEQIIQFSNHNQKNNEDSSSFIAPESAKLSIEIFKNNSLLLNNQFKNSNLQNNLDVIRMFQSQPKATKVIGRATNLKIATIRGISSSQEGSSLFATITDTGMQIWDYVTGCKIRIVPNIKYGIYIAKHKCLACCESSVIKIISMSNYKVIRTLKSKSSFIIRLYYDEKSDLLYSSGNSGKVEIWDILKGELQYCVGEGGQQIYSITQCDINNRSILFYGEKDGQITSYDISQKRVIANRKTIDQIFFLKVIQDSDTRQQLLIAVASQKIIIFNPLTLEYIKIQQFIDFINSAMIVQDTLFITLGNEGLIILMRLSVSQQFPIFSSSLQYGTERFALCWIEKSKTLIYNSKSIKPKKQVLSHNHLSNNILNDSNNLSSQSSSSSSSSQQQQDPLDNNSNHTLNQIIDQGFPSHFNPNSNSLYNPANETPAGDDIIICQY